MNTFKKITLGGFGQTSKILQKYSLSENDVYISANIRQLLNVRVGHHQLIKQLTYEINNSKYPVIIHSISSSAWYLIPLLSSNNFNNISGIIFESSVYHFNYSPMIKMIHNIYPISSYVPMTIYHNFFDVFLNFNGATLQWKNDYIQNFNSLSSVYKCPILIICNTSDNIVPISHSSELFEQLKYNSSNSQKIEQYISTIKNNNIHGQLLKYDSNYTQTIKNFINLCLK